MSRRGRQAEAAELLSQVESGEIAALFQLQSITATPRPPPGLEPTAVVPIVAAFLRERVPEERDAARAAWMLGLSALANACVAVDQEDAPPSVRELFASHIAPVLARLEAALPLLGPIESAADHRPDSDPGSYPLTAVLRLLSNTTCSWIRPSYADVPELVRLAPRLAGVFAREKRLGGVPSGDQGVVSALLVSVVFNQSKDPQLCRAMLGEPACIDGLAQLWPTLRDPKLRVHLLEAVHQLGECALHAEAGGPSGFAVLASCASMGALVHEVLVRDDECIPSAAPASTHTFALGLATNLLNNEREAALKVLGHARVLLPVAEKLARATDAEQRELGAAVLDALLRDLASLRKLVADLAAADRLRLAAQGAHPVLQELGRTLALVGMPDASAPTPAAEHAKNFACHNAECSKLAQPGEQFKQCSGCRNVRYCSPECQKQDWRRHKRACKEHQAQAAQHGGSARFAASVMKVLEDKAQDWFQDNLVPVFMLAAEWKVAPTELVLAADFTQLDEEGQPRTRVVREADISRLRRIEWWDDRVQADTDEYLVKRRESVRAGQRVEQVVYVARFDRGVIGGRFIMPLEGLKEVKQAARKMRSDMLAAIGPARIVPTILEELNAASD